MENILQRDGTRQSGDNKIHKKNPTLASVQYHLTRVLVYLLGGLVHPPEVLVAGGTAKPGLSKMHPSHEEEAAGARLHATAQECPDATC